MKRCISWFLVLTLLFSASLAAHSGRTDSSGGHRDNRNASGLGSYHYHCGGNPPHLHSGGACPYAASTYSAPSSSSSTKSPAQSDPNRVSATCTRNKISLNGVTAAQISAASGFDCLIYNDITYIPMTYDLASHMGLHCSFSMDEGLVVAKAEQASVMKTTTSSVSTFTAPVEAVKATGKITVNEKAIDNAAELYPLLIYEDITYFPMTWRFAVEEFGWDYAFDDVHGLVVTCAR